MDTHWIFMALASLGRLGQRLQIHGYPLDIHGIGMTGTMWDPVFRVDWGNLQPIGYPWHWHPWVDWDPGWHPCVDWDSWNPGTILDLRHPSRQTGTMWDPVFRVDWGNLQIHGYPLDIHGIGSRLGQCIPIGSSWHWHPWVDWDSVESWDNLRS